MTDYFFQYLLESTMAYPPSFFIVRDRFNQLMAERTKGFDDARSRFLRRAWKEPHAHFCAPGPGSPTRWVIFSVHDFLYPNVAELPPSYVVEVRDEEYLESLKALAMYFLSPPGSPPRTDD